MSKPFMFIQAPVATRSGYGAHSRDIVRSLIKMDKFDIQIGSLRWGACPMNALNEQDPNDKMIIDRLFREQQLTRQPDIGVEIRVPNEYQAIGKFNIGITAGIETTMCAAEWLQGCNRMDLNLVPSEHAKRVFENSKFEKRNNQTQQVDGELKLERPMEVLFEGADTEIYKQTNEIPETIYDELNDIKENFNFLFVGHWLKGNLGQDRKDTGMLVKVFLETFKNFKNKPGLILKTSGAGFSIMDRDEITSKIKALRDSMDGDLPNVYLLHGDLTDDEMNGLYNHPKVKSHVSFTKGEGFGRPLLEASLSEKPVIASGWSGHVDFLDKDLSVLLPGEIKDVHETAQWDKVILKGSKWFTVNYDYGSKVLDHVFKNYKTYKERARKQGIINKTKFSFDSMTDVFTTILDSYLPKFSEEVKLNLPNINIPKLKKVDSNKSSKSNVKEIKLPKLKKDIKLPELKEA